MGGKGGGVVSILFSAVCICYPVDGLLTAGFGSGLRGWQFLYCMPRGSVQGLCVSAVCVFQREGATAFLLPQQSAVTVSVENASGMPELPVKEPPRLMGLCMWVACRHSSVPRPGGWGCLVLPHTQPAVACCFGWSGLTQHSG